MQLVVPHCAVTFVTGFGMTHAASLVRSMGSGVAAVRAPRAPLAPTGVTPTLMTFDWHGRIGVRIVLLLMKPPPVAFVAGTTTVVTAPVPTCQSISVCLRSAIGSPEVYVVGSVYVMSGVVLVGETV